MKKWFKVLGIMALAAIIGFFPAGFEIEPEDKENGPNIKIAVKGNPVAGQALTATVSGVNADGGILRMKGVTQ